MILVVFSVNIIGAKGLATANGLDSSAGQR